MTARKKTSAAAKAKSFTWSLLRKHFRGLDISELVTSSRSFPVTARVDLQKALDELVREVCGDILIGLHQQWGSNNGLTVARLWAKTNYPVMVGPLQFEEVDLGDATPARCLKHALWLARANGVPFAFLLTPEEHYGRIEGVMVEIAVRPGKEGLDISNGLMSRLEKAIAEGRSYRGKVLSLEAEDVREALEELLFTGGSLNAKLLGAACNYKPSSP